MFFFLIYAFEFNLANVQFELKTNKCIFVQSIIKYRAKILFRDVDVYFFQKINKKSIKNYIFIYFRGLL